MNVIYSEKAKQWGEGRELLEQATQQLEDVLGPAAGGVKAEWDREEDAKGCPVYTLSLADREESASASFTPDELQSSHHLRYRLYSLWDDVLKLRVHRSLEKLLEAGSPES